MLHWNERKQKRKPTTHFHKMNMCKSGHGSGFLAINYAIITPNIQPNPLHKSDKLFTIQLDTRTIAWIYTKMFLFYFLDNYAVMSLFYLEGIYCFHFVHRSNNVEQSQNILDYRILMCNFLILLPTMAINRHKVF